MPLETWFAFFMFAFVTSITPGPNNFMLLSSGVNYGFKLSIPHMLGISSGFLLMVLAVGLGLAEVFDHLPWIYNLLKWLGAIYMLYLAWCIARSGPVKDTKDKGSISSPMSFFGAALFQLINPKAWIMAVSAFSTYVPASSGFATIACTALLFAVVNLPCVGVWALFGSRLRHVLQVRSNLLAFNYSMAGLLVASLYPLLSH